MTNTHLTEEEKLIDAATPEPTWIDSGGDFEIRKKHMEDVANQTPEERISVSIKILASELAAFKQFAASEWLKYQTKLNQFVYLYNRSKNKKFQAW